MTQLTLCFASTELEEMKPSSQNPDVYSVLYHPHCQSCFKCAKYWHSLQRRPPHTDFLTTLCICTARQDGYTWQTVDSTVHWLKLKVATSQATLGTQQTAAGFCRVHWKTSLSHLKKAASPWIDNTPHTTFNRLFLPKHVLVAWNIWSFCFIKLNK